MKIAIGIDTGGTCTDAVAYDYESQRVIAKGKTLTTREDLSIGISKALDALPQELIQSAAIVSLSTTLATNACVENKGGRAKLVLFGMTDELMQRLKVEEQYGIKKGYVRCVDTKSAADGSHIDEPNWEELFEEYSQWLSDVDYMACAELYGPTTGAPCEKKFKQFLKEKKNLDCVCADELTARIDVIQRGATALLNARLLPVVQEFIGIAVADIRKRGCDAPIMVVRSDGRLMSTDATKLKPVETILSGPAASILAGKAFTDKGNYMVVDMGGTTTDVSMVQNKETLTAKEGISIGGWKTSVDGVFVDTFALGGDSTIRFIKGELTIDNRRCVSMCNAATRWPFIKDQLKELFKAGYWGKFHMYECLYLVRMPKDLSRYDEQERILIDILKDGPGTLHYLKEHRGLDLYILDTKRLEDEGVIIRFGLTPTDFMHIKGDYTEFDAEASMLAAKCALFSALKPFEDADAMALADEVYDAVECKMYSNLVRILVTQDHSRALKNGLSKELEHIIKDSWKVFKGEKRLAISSFKTDMVLLGMGAPTHVFLPKVAEALGTTCILPENAEIGNAIGAVMSEPYVKSSVTITQWDEGGLSYLVHTPDGSFKYQNLGEATKLARKIAIEKAEKEARLRGAKGKLDVRVYQEGNSHDKFAGESLVYGGTVYAEIKFNL
ncbi:MAG: hydantoinase/oxoprolinase family protein [Clostridia bacterium]|nr:hydantoinase/oxoprolinase family protein [Clostridia bacterium]